MSELSDQMQSVCAWCMCARYGVQEHKNIHDPRYKCHVYLSLLVVS